MSIHIAVHAVQQSIQEPQMRGPAEALPHEIARKQREAATEQPRESAPCPRAGGAAGAGGAGNGRAARLAFRIAFALLAVAALFRLILLLRGWPSLDSDEAVVGLMARHILHNGEYPNFFWGQFYLGTLQAYFAAGIFAVFGSSLFALRLPVLLLVLGFFVAVYALGRAAYGRVVGLLALAWLAFGPPYALIRELVADGGHQEMLLLAAVLLLGVWDRLRRPDARPTNRRGWLRLLAIYAGLGFAAGLGLWSDLLILPVLLLSGVALVAGRTREVFSRCGLALVLGFCLGAFPLLQFNLTNNNATFTQIEEQRSLPGQGHALPPLDQWQRQIGETLAVAIPITYGSPRVCVSQGNVWNWYPPTLIRELPSVSACQGANILFSLGILSVYLSALWALLLALRLWLRTLPARGTALRGWFARRGLLRAGPTGPTGSTGSTGPTETAPAAVPALDREVAARLWLRAMLLGIALFTLAAYTLSSDAQINQFTAVRYLIPLYLTVPLLFGQLWRWAVPVGHWLTDRVGLAGATSSAATAGAASRKSIGAWVAMAAIALLLSLNLAGATVTLAYSGDANRFGLPTTSDDQRLIAFLDAHGITRYYSDYWTCYRIAFESNERILCAIRGQNGEPQLHLINNRYPPYERLLAGTPHPAYILPAGTPVDRGFADFAAQEGLPHDGYIRVQVGDFAIYYHP